MILVAVALAWAAIVNVLALHGKNMGAGRFFGCILGRWPQTDGEPGPGEIILILLGRIGLVLFFVIFSNLIWGRFWRESLICLVLILAGPVLARFWLSEDTILPGLDGAKTLLQWPDGYRCLTGRVGAEGPLAGITLADLDLRRRGWLVLAIMRGSFASHFPKGQEVLTGGDLLLLYGHPEDAPARRA